MWYQIYSGFSGSAFVDDTNLLGFNLFYTSLPPIVFGIVDQCAPDHLLMANPRLYHRVACSHVYKSYSYFICIIDGLWQSLVQFYIPYGVSAVSCVSHTMLCVLPTMSYLVMCSTEGSLTKTAIIYYVYCTVQILLPYRRI